MRLRAALFLGAVLALGCSSADFALRTAESVGDSAQPSGTFCNGFEDQCDGAGNCVDCVNSGRCGECCTCSPAKVCVPA